MAEFRNRLRDLMQNPGSFEGSVGYNFARDQALGATSRAMSGQRGSGNALAALQRQAAGLAQQDYGNEVDRSLRAAQLEQQGSQFDRDLDLRGELGRGDLALRGELGRGDLGLRRDDLALRGELGRGELGLNRDRLGLDRERFAADRDLGRDRLGLDRELGTGQLGLQRDRLGLDRDLGMGRLGLDDQRSWMDYDLGSQDRETNRFNARTNRGRERSIDWARREELRRTRPRNPWTWEYE